MKKASLPAGNSSPPELSVIIPAYNAQDFIACTIESVLSQSFTDFELLIVDDGSQDATREVIRQYKTDARLRLLEQSSNRGQPATRNHGIRQARGQYLAFLDADDISTPDRFEKQLQALKDNPALSGVGSLMSLIDHTGRIIRQIQDDYPRTPKQIACHVLANSPMAHPTVMIKTEAIRAFEYNESFRLAQDYELWSRMLPRHQFMNLQEPLTLYRQHTGQVGQAQINRQTAARLAVQQRLLENLQMHPSQQDLIRHDCLFNFKDHHVVASRTGASLDIDYLQWARWWLEKLLTHNHELHLHPETELLAMVKKRWHHACRQARKNSPEPAIWWQRARFHIFCQRFKKSRQEDNFQS